MNPEPLMTPVTIVWQGMNLETREHLNNGRIIKLYRKRGGSWLGTARQAFEDKQVAS